jgi:hypothetical protein
MSIIAAVFAGVHLCLSAGAIPFVHDQYYYSDYYYNHIKASKVKKSS